MPIKEQYPKTEVIQHKRTSFGSWRVTAVHKGCYLD